MVKFAPVCPIHIYNALAKEGKEFIGNYFLLLAHDVLAHPTEYHNFFFKIPKDQRTIIMDNSVIELGSSCDAQTLFEACNIVDANVVVIPDVLEKGGETFDAMVKFHHEWSELKRGGIDYDKMFVPQGVNADDYRMCVQAGIEFNEKNDFFNWMGVARNLTVRVYPSRMQALQVIHDHLRFVRARNHPKIHMMGFSDHVSDDFRTCRMLADHIEGIDSAVPLRIGSNGGDLAGIQQLTQVYPDAGKRGNWWEEVTYNKLIGENVLTTRKSLGA